MPQVLVLYFSHGGNTRKMAEAVAKAVEGAGCGVSLKKVDQAAAEDLEQADGIIFGSPCYFGNIAGPLKDFIDKTISSFGKSALVGKPGAVFASTGGIGGGGELTMISLLTAMLIHGMVVMGNRKGGHLGPLAIGEPDERALNECRDMGQRFAELVLKLAV